MERGEERAQAIYASIADEVPGALKIYEDEQEHERELLSSPLAALFCCLANAVLVIMLFTFYPAFPIEL